MRKSRALIACGDSVQRAIETFRVLTPIGEMVLNVCSRGLHMIYQVDDITDENFSPDRSIHVTMLSEPAKDAKMKVFVDDILNWLICYFHDAQSVSNLSTPSFCPLLKDDLLFKDKVLMCLAKLVPPGKTTTYGELATLAGSPGAQQAVGSVMAANPFQLIVPCHRVVKSGQKVGKYSGGCRNMVKIWLLQHEGFNVHENGTVSAK